ncbi:hypothetical protein AB0I68_13345 [Streptomyces sp. NPDC050448]|uniref:hypothetical protein n=1 Tax=Streptomyces sp. NPDC050448 TaxID=3155404 RepID=UPI003420199D
MAAGGPQTRRLREAGGYGRCAGPAAYRNSCAVEGELLHAYVSTGRTGEIDRLRGLAADRWADAFCLADDDAGPGLSPREQQRAVAAFLEAYFPVPSPYEKSRPIG